MNKPYTIKQNTFVLLWLSLTFWTLAVSHAQQDAYFSLYNYHMNMFNPAVSGVENAPFINTTIRSQWYGVEDAPETQVFSYATPTRGGRVGLGLNVINDKTFVEKQTQIFASFSYRLQMNTKTDLYLGLQAGANAYRVNAAGLDVTGENRSDPNLIDHSQLNPNIGVGLYLKHPKYYLSLSAPKLLNSARFRDQQGLTTSASDRVHIYAAYGRRLKLGQRWTLIPSAIYRHVANAPSLWTVNLAAQLNNDIDFGVEYNINSGFGGTLMLGSGRTMAIGYAYSGSSYRQIQSVSPRGTHEFLLKIKLGKERIEPQQKGENSTIDQAIEEARIGTRNKERNNRRS